MPRTYEPIASTTLGSSSASVTFGSGGTLPQGYTDLVLVTDLRHASNLSTTSIRFNGDTGTNYSSTFLAGSGSAASSGRNSNDQWINIAVNGANTTDRIVTVTHIQSYANTNINKTALVAWANPNREVIRQVGLWRNTAAITSLTVVCNNTMADGSVLSLYGIKAA